MNVQSREGWRGEPSGTLVWWCKRLSLSTTHGCWEGPYSDFHEWRAWIAARVGLPLNLMQGFYRVPNRPRMREDEIELPGLPIPWSIINDPLVLLLDHSDCEGCLKWWDCDKIAIRLLQTLRDAPSGTPKWLIDATKSFALGCLRAYKLREHVEFH